MNAARLLQSAHGNWAAILLAAGVPDRFLTGKHGPCPFCGGKDRYRFTDYQQRGGFICSQCNPDGGDGLALLMQWRSDDFKQALKWLADYLRLPSSVLAVDRQAAPITSGPTLDEMEKRNQRMARMWQQAEALTGDCIGSRYLQARGVWSGVDLPDPLALRFIPDLAYFTGKEKQGDHPALLAVVSAPAGHGVSLHRTYLQLDGSSKADVPEPKKLMPPVGTITGAAIRLFSAGPVLGVAEGIETAMAASLLHDVPVWACISAHGLQSFVVPEAVTDLLIFADNDRAGLMAARALLERYQGKLQRVEIIATNQPGKDWSDVAKEQTQWAI
jgi:putative DNA primase/helicase